MRTHPQIIAIVWAPEERRTEMFAARLGAPVFHVHYLKYKNPLYAPFKYPLQWLKTWAVLWRERPRVVYVTNPPILAGLCVYVYSLAARCRVILDTHPPALYSKKWGWSVPVQRWLIKRVYLNVIDQERYVRLFESWGGRAVMLERPPKHLDTPSIGSMPAGAFRVAVINTFAEDEPLQPVLDAAKLVPDIQFEITGDLSRADDTIIKAAPTNCTFTGYLLGNDYENLLHRSHVVMSLTTFPYSLLGSAQEGMTLGKVLILSDQPVLREYFSKGTLFVSHEPDSIAAAVQQARERCEELSAQVIELRDERAAAWERAFEELARAARQ